MKTSQDHSIFINQVTPSHTHRNSLCCWSEVFPCQCFYLYHSNYEPASEPEPHTEPSSEPQSQGEQESAAEPQAEPAASESTGEPHLTVLLLYPLTSVACVAVWRQHSVHVLLTAMLKCCLWVCMYSCHTQTP